MRIDFLSTLFLAAVAFSSVPLASSTYYVCQLSLGLGTVYVLCFAVDLVSCISQVDDHSRK